MTVQMYLVFEIVKNILVIAVLLLFATSLTFLILADIAKLKANKALQKGFHVEFTNVEQDIDLDEISKKISEKLKSNN